MAPAVYTKLVANKLRTGAALGHDLAVHGKSLPEKVAAALNRKELAGSIEQLLAGVGTAREEADGTLAKADTAYLAELSDDPTHRKQRDDATSHLYSTLTGVRAIVETMHGRDEVRALGFIGDTPRDPSSLLRLASVVIQKLPGLPPPPKGCRITVDVEGLCQDVRTAVNGAEQAIEGQRADQRENEAAIRDRNVQLATSERVQRFLSRLLFACAEAVEDDDLVRRFRSSLALPTSRAGSLSATDEEVETEQLEAPTSKEGSVS